MSISLLSEKSTPAHVETDVEYERWLDGLDAEHERRLDTVKHKHKQKHRRKSSTLTRNSLINDDPAA